MDRAIAMIPARLGSQRLKKKNLELFGAVTLLEHAIERCLSAGVFEEIYVNSESTVFKKYADGLGVSFYHRPACFGSNESTSEDFVADFFENIDCDILYQIHSITPLLSSSEIKRFAEFCQENPSYDTVFSCIEDQIEVAFKGEPVNFTICEKTNSQNIIPTQRITWSATKWSRKAFLDARHGGGTGSYSGKIGYFAVAPFSGLAIKTLEDLTIARAIRELI
jgi:CMP-N-acetylneuraminic acid synthetase